MHNTPGINKYFEQDFQELILNENNKNIQYKHLFLIIQKIRICIQILQEYIHVFKSQVLHLIKEQRFNKMHCPSNI